MEFIGLALFVSFLGFIGDIIFQIGWFVVVIIVGGVLWLGGKIIDLFREK